MTDIVPDIDQLSLFDAALQARQDGIDRADANADEHWKLAAERIINHLAHCHVPFTSDDVVERLERIGVTTHNWAALGPVFQRASRSGLIRKTGALVPSRIPRRHRDLTEWIGRDPF